jgi:hypothetical protein
MSTQAAPACLALSIALALAWLGLGGDADAAVRYLYYNQGSKFDAERAFPFQVLKLILAKSGKPYQLRPSPIGRATESRAIDALAAGEQIDVAWLGVSRSVDSKLLPVRIPIERGLLGYRVFLIDKRRQGDFRKIASLQDLRRFRALQAGGWPDIEVLRNAGIEVRTGDYTHLFQMTLARRGDYFPRSAMEAFVEKDRHAEDAPGLAVEETVALHYPLTSMFYVRKSDTTLHDDLYRGFQRAYADGSYMRLFTSNPDIRTALRQAKLAKRRIIEIENPFFPVEDRTIDARYWYRP